MSYEATIRVTHISTSSSARKSLSVSNAVGAAKANLRYITRDDAAQDGNVIARSNGVFLTGTTDDLKSAAKNAIDERSEKHREGVGVRLADKMIVSLPNDATIIEQRKMCGDILKTLTGDSEAFGMASIHTDKEGNNHAHFLFVDGLETKEAAIKRRPEAKRVRRAEHLQLNDGGNRQDLRYIVAECINRVGAENGRSVAEVRSFKDRGIDREPQEHEGPRANEAIDQEHVPKSKGILARLKANAIAMRKRLEGKTPEGASIDPNELPRRYRKGWLGSVWLDHIRSINRQRTAGQDVSAQETVEAGVSAFVADWSQQTPQASHTPRPEVLKQVQDAVRRTEQPQVIEHVRKRQRAERER